MVRIHPQKGKAMKKHFRKKIMICTTIIALLCVTFLSACTPNTDTNEIIETPANSVSPTVAVETIDTATILEQMPDIEYDEISVKYDTDDLDDSFGSDAYVITLGGDAITCDNEDATVDGSIITITTAGTYIISGTLANGQIIVDTNDKETVKLVLSGADITCKDDAPITILNAKKAVITLAPDTVNTITDGDAVVSKDSDSLNAAIYSKDDLTINGSGSLTVNANNNNGIYSNNDLKIISGSITVNAAANGIKAKDSVVVKDGIITITAAADGIESSDDKDNGYVAIEGGTLSITAALDGIQAATSVLVSGGDITILAGGGSVNGLTYTVETGWDKMGPADSLDTQSNSEDGESNKGIKVVDSVQVTGGTITINAADDAIHAENSFIMDDGTVVIATGDDAIHGEEQVVINGGDITVTECYEGLESAIVIIDDGNIDVTSNDDGVNAAGGDNIIYINGGNITINSIGDGLDANGYIYMTDGHVIINGPIFEGNGGLDADNGCVVNGGTLVVASSHGMSQSASKASTQNAIMVMFPSIQTAGTIIHIEDANGEEILTFAPAKEYQTLAFSTSTLTIGEDYTIYTGGSSTGTSVDGLYTDGTYTDGIQLVAFTLSETVTGVTESGTVDSATLSTEKGGGDGMGGGPGGMDGAPR